MFTLNNALNFKLKFREHSNYHEKKTAHRYIVTAVLLKALKQRPINVESFRHS